MEILTALGRAVDSRSSVSIPCACQEEQGCTRCSRGNPSACAAPVPLPRGTGARANVEICVTVQCSLCLGSFLKESFTILNFFELRLGLGGYIHIYAFSEFFLTYFSLL